MINIREGGEEEDRQLRRSPSYDSLFGDEPSQDGDLEESLTPQSHPPTGVSNVASARPSQESHTNTSSALPSRLGADPTCGVAWVKRELGSYPTWVVEPTIESIITTLQAAIGPNHDYSVQLLHNGSLSRLYDVSFDNQAFVMRISLPLCLRTKTEAEVATLDWVSQHTQLPVPQVKAYDASRNNSIGYEWLLMTKLNGKPLSACWPSVAMASKERVVKQIVDFVISTFRQPFYEGIGSITKKGPSSDGHIHVVGELVTMAFF